MAKPGSQMNLPRNEYPMTLKQVAEEMTRRGDKMSKTRVEQIEKRALRKLREHPEIDALFRRMMDDTL